MASTRTLQSELLTHVLAICYLHGELPRER